jgi:hercynylcysteine S-oxide lyase
VLKVGQGNTTYNSVSRTAAYLHDIKPHPSVSEFTILFPTTPKKLLERWKAHLKQLNAARNRKVIIVIQQPNIISIRTQIFGKKGKIVAVVDALISNPGVILPWEEMVGICREENVWSVVDAAHAIGQQYDLKLEETKPDFWVSVRGAPFSLKFNRN